MFTHHNIHFILLILTDGGFYLAVGGAIGEHAWGHLHDVIREQKFDVTLTDASERIGMLSVQGYLSFL